MRSSAVIDFAENKVATRTGARYRLRREDDLTEDEWRAYYDPQRLKPEEKQSIINYIFAIRKGLSRTGPMWQYICQNYDISLIEICRYYFYSIGDSGDGVWTDLTSEDPYTVQEARKKVHEYMQSFIRFEQAGVHGVAITPPRVLMRKYQFGSSYPDSWDRELRDAQMAIINYRFVVPLDVTEDRPPGPRVAHKPDNSGRGPKVDDYQNNGNRTVHY
jgi:hypothetical protein